MSFWVAGAVVVGGVASAAIGSSAAKSAADTQSQAAGSASAVQQHMFDTATANQQPYMQSGYGAQNTLNRLLGIAPQTATGGVPGAPSTSSAGWDASNGVLLGDTYFPPGTTAASPGNKSGSDILYNGQVIGHVFPGGANGRYANTSGQPLPSPAQVQGTSGGGNNVSSMAGLNGTGMGPIPGGSPMSGMTGQTGDSTGLPTGYLTQQFGPDQYKANMDPGYGFQLTQGQNALTNSSAATTGTLSGAALKSMIGYNQDYASTGYQNAFNRFETQQGNIFQRLSDVANRGQSAAAGVGQQGVQTGANIGANIVGAGNASAAGQIGVANAYGSALNSLGTGAMYYGMQGGS